jgi:hypothetical protein
LLFPPLYRLKLCSFHADFIGTAEEDTDDGIGDGMYGGGTSVHGIKQYVAQQILEQKLLKRAPKEEKPAPVAVEPKIEKPVKVAETRDFFGRLLEPDKKMNIKGSKNESFVFYRYHEKYSDAVKKTIKGKDWWDNKTCG